MAELNGNNITELKKRWGIYQFADLGKRCAPLGSTEYLIEGILPVRTLSVVVGDSGLGKSPLLYQAGMCIASGTPFLGRLVRQGTVLYLDAENGLGQVDEIGRSLCQFLGLKEPPPNFVGWNLNDCPANWEGIGGAESMIREVRPDLVIIDPASAFWPDIQENNRDAAQLYKSLRRIMREAGCAIILVHHTRKNGADQSVQSIADCTDQRAWFEKARGPRTIINGSDVRLAVDLPGSKAPEEAALVVGGFGRVRGAIPLLYLERVLGEDGEPKGYRQIVGVQLLPTDQRQAFEKLPPEFRFKEAKLAYGRASQPTIDWLGKCVAAGILKKLSGSYVKLKVPPPEVSVEVEVAA